MLIKNMKKDGMLQYAKAYAIKNQEALNRHDLPGHYYGLMTYLNRKHKGKLTMKQLNQMIIDL